MKLARLTDAEIGALPHSHPAWAVQGTALVRSFTFADFNTAWAFMTRVALLAEQQDHHPDWSNAYNRVRIALTTHDAGGLTDRDVRLAAAIDQLQA